MHWVLLLALSNGGIAVFDVENQQHCEEIRVNYQKDSAAGSGLPQLDTATTGIEWTVCTVSVS